MTRVMLIAGVAALAIAAPAAAGPHGGHGGGHGDRQQASRNGGGGFDAPRAQARQRANFDQRGRARADFGMQRQRGEQRQARAFQRQRNQQREAHAMQAQRNEQRQADATQAHHNKQRQARVQMQRDQQRQARAFQQHRQEQQRHEQARMFQQRNELQARNFRQAQDVRREQVRDSRDHQQRQRFEEHRMAQMQQMRRERDNERADYGRIAARQFAQNDFARRYASVRDVGRFNACPPGLRAKGNGCLPPGQAMKLLGSPVSRAASYTTLAALPQPLRYLYPETPDYYYRYGDGYLYQVNRGNGLIDSLLPLMAGGYMPGMTFPTAYRNSYVPDYYGYNSFYPDSDYSDYRYLNGNVYSLDPYSGTIQDVIPTYGYGYGVGQMLPAGYGYYNVPSRYRSVYYNTPDANYWYAPGAIYQVDPSTQLITSVASLLGPGMAIGQPLPMGYNTYNVPMAYRSTYYDTPNAWYRYNNGNIYQVDPTTQIVTAIVASLLS